jgi:hypothetical protein
MKVLITPNQYKIFESQPDIPFLNARLYVRSDPRPGRSGGQFEVPIQISNPSYNAHQDGEGKKFKAFKKIVKSASSAAAAAAPIAISTGNPYAAIGLASAGLVGNVVTGGGSVKPKKISRYSLAEDDQLYKAKKKTRKNLRK